LCSTVGGQCTCTFFFIKKIIIKFLQDKPWKKKTARLNKVCNAPFRRPPSKQPVYLDKHESLVVLHGGVRQVLSYFMDRLQTFLAGFSR
ncbi:MAG: hypothetical protein ACK56F_03070, partial [bacterium]